MDDSEEPVNPFQFMLSDIAKALGAANVDPAELRRQFSALALGAGNGYDSVDPGLRSRVEPLWEIAVRYVSGVPLAASLMPASPPSLVVQRPSDYAEALLRDLAPYLDMLAQSLAGGVPGMAGMAPAQMGEIASLAASLSAQIGPMFANSQVGSICGHYALGAVSDFDLVLPRPKRSTLALEASAVARQAELIGAPLEEVALYLMMRELVVSAAAWQPVIADRYDTELRLYLLDLKADAARMIERLSQGAISDPEFLANFDPASLLTQDQSPAQQANLAEMATTLAFVEAVAMLAVGQIRTSVFGNSQWIERLGESRDEEPARVMLATTFGIDLAEVRERARRFGQRLRDADQALDSLLAALSDADKFPSPQEFDDPQIWLLRLQVEG